MNRSLKLSRAPGTLRIIAGRWRGRRLAVPDLPGLRPTPDRVRETLFNWLAPRMPGARCLDLFAGSGALGLEAASRGAREVTLVDRSGEAVRRLREHGERLAADQIRVVQADALVWLAGQSTPYDIVFLDPPFGQDLLAGVVVLLERRGWLAPDARLYLEAEAALEHPPLPEGWSNIRKGKAGQVRYYLAAVNQRNTAQS